MSDLWIFDCDGVLIDSEILAARIESRLLEALGVAIAPLEISARYSGLSEASMEAGLRRDFGVELPADFWRRSAAATAELFEQELQPMPHVREVVAALPGPRCVASSSAPERLERSLRHTGLWQHFAPHVFSAAQVERGKPAPDLFLFAARQLAAEPGRCTVIEDSVYGVRAARAAGMRVFGFVGGSHCAPARAEALAAEGAEAVLEDLRELPGFRAAAASRSTGRP